MLCHHCKRLCLTVVAIFSQLFCEMWSRRRFSSDAVSTLLHLRRVTAATARVWSYSLCLLWNMLTRGFAETSVSSNSLSFAAYIATKFNPGNCEGRVLRHRVRAHYFQWCASFYLLTILADILPAKSPSPAKANSLVHCIVDTCGGVH